MYKQATFVVGALALLNSLPASAQTPGSVFDMVKTYNADNTGNSDVATAFNTALTACRNAGDGVLWFGAGTYLFNTGVTNNAAGCSIRGAGQRATTFKSGASSGDMITIAEYGNTISDIGFQGASNWTSGYAVALTQSSYGIARDLYFMAVPGAVSVGGGSSEVRLENLYIGNPKGAAAICCGSSTSQSAVYGLRVHNVAIGYNLGVSTYNTYTDGYLVESGCNMLTISNASVSGGGTESSPSGNRCIHVPATPTGYTPPQFITLNDFECDHSLGGVLLNGGSVVQSMNGFFGSNYSNGQQFSI